MEKTHASSSALQGLRELRGARGATPRGQAGAQDEGFAAALAASPDAAALAAWMAGQQPGAVPARAAEGVMGGEADVLMGRVGLGLLRQGQDSLVGQTALLDGAAEAGALNGALQPAGRVGAAHALPAGQAMAAQGMAVQDAAGAGAGHRVHAGAEAARPGTEQAAAQAAPAAQAASAAPPERRDTSPALAQPTAEWVAPGMAAGAMAGAATGGPAPAAPGEGEPRTAQAAGPQGAQPHASEAADAAQSPADAAQSGMGSAEEQLAEQVAYWVHHKTQNAALTLDGDGRPVEVKVALTGDQAHVTFGSDQAEARQLLDTGTAELRAMLQGEGLQLAGVTVGTAGGDGAPQRQGAREGGGRQDARQATVRAAAPAGLAAARPGTGTRAVDIFV